MSREMAVLCVPQQTSVEGVCVSRLLPLGVMSREAWVPCLHVHTEWMSPGILVSGPGVQAGMCQCGYPWGAYTDHWACLQRTGVGQ